MLKNCQDERFVIKSDCHNSLSLWMAPIGPFMILSWQLDDAGWLISIISFMILILAARWRRKPKARNSAHILPEFDS